MKESSKKTIHNIIFDFGGVIIEISHLRLEESFRRYGVENFDLLFSQAMQSELFREFEKGEITPVQFRKEFRKLTNLDISDDILDQLWNQIIGDYPPHRIELLKRIKGNYRLVLFSNTNIIHYNFYIEKFKQEFGFDFHSLFDNTYWSFKMGKRKPDLASFSEIIVKEGLIPEETLFIDDSIQNIVAAKQLELKTIHLVSGLDITDLFKDGLLL